MEQLTGLGKAIAAADSVKIKLDQTITNILAYKPLLARIFKEVISECRDMTCDEIERCIEGEVQIREIYVDSGLSNAGERIDGLSEKSYLNDEGLNRYDIRTYLKIPGENGNEFIKLIINVEAQNEDRPGYDIPLRALFYCCRMISEQQGVEFTTDTDDHVKYGNIKKVYSIWLCTETAQKRANSIEKYSINKEFLVGSNDDSPRYDILTAVIINISKKNDTGSSDNELIKMLTDLFDSRIEAADKIRKLKADYGLKTTREINTEVTKMCTYADALEKKSFEMGEVVNLIKMITRKIIMGKNEDLIAQELDEDPVRVSEICSVAKRFAPDYDPKKIYEELDDLITEGV